LQEYFIEDKNTGKYVCNKCNKESSRFVKLVQHIERHHGNDGNYLCGLCQELESTEPTGVGYLCCVCDVVFDVPRDLEDHMATHDSIWIFLHSLTLECTASLYAFSIFAQVNVTNPTSWLVKFDVLSCYIHLRWICLRFCYVVGQRQPFCVASKMAATIDKSNGKA
jgi:hypothetical protein